MLLAPWQICVRAMKVMMTLITCSALRPFEASWKLAFPTFSVVITVVTAIYLVYLALTAAGRGWLFWLTRVLCLLAFLGDLIFLIVTMLDHDAIGRKIMVAVYFGVSTMEFAVNGRWTKTHWRARLLPPTYAPILHGATVEDADIDADLGSAGEIATLYAQLTVVSPTQDVLKRSTAKKRQREWNRPEAGALIQFAS